MRRSFYGVLRGAVVFLVFVSFSLNAVAAPREAPQPRERGNPVGKVLKKIIRTLGDGLIIPTP